MYSRTITEAPEELIKNGKPIFGTFGTMPARLDIRGVEQPFSFPPLPAFLTNFQIRSNMSFMFNTRRIIGSIDFFSINLFGFAEVVLWDTETNRKYAYRTVVGPRRKFIPYNLWSGRCSTHRSGRLIKISWNRKEKRLSLTARLDGDSLRPTATLVLKAQLDSPLFSEAAAVIPAPVTRRCRAIYRLTAPISGTVSLMPKTGDQLSIPANDGSALFDMHRAYYKLRTKSEYAYGFGKIGERHIAFSLADSTIEAMRPNEYNENFLFCGGKLTALPPVKITCPLGINGDWIIQDTKSMVDLVFTPRSVYSRMHSLVVLTTRYHSIYGAFNGVLLTKTGEKIVLKDFLGVTKKHLIRL
ncbi:MAG: DUF2804 domain-containing protein [Treponema sp.]|jgi:hypothetical protein|nr:DUF2804 domain-containing protein [Treponema sp.]